MTNPKISIAPEQPPSLYALLRLSIRVAVAEGRADDALKWVEIAERLTAQRGLDGSGRPVPSLGEEIGID